MKRNASDRAGTVARNRRIDAPTERTCSRLVFYGNEIRNGFLEKGANLSFVVEQKYWGKCIAGDVPGHDSSLLKREIISRESMTCY